MNNDKSNVSPFRNNNNNNNNPGYMNKNNNNNISPFRNGNNNNTGYIKNNKNKNNISPFRGNNENNPGFMNNNRNNNNISPFHNNNDNSAGFLNNRQNIALNNNYIKSKNNNTVTVCSNSVYNFQNGTKMVSCTSIHSPFGKTTKPTENSIIQAIQKISQIKQGSKQAVNGKPFILYIDLDTGNIRGMSHLFDTTYPIHYSKDGEITSEIIWHAMYGKKGYPIFERHPYYMLPCSKSWWYKLKNKLVKHKNTIPFDKLICTMNHDGRFLTDHYVSAVIFRCENHVIICENQYANNKLHRSTRLHLKRIPKVDIAKSILNLIPGMIIFKNMRYRYIVRRLLF